LKWPALRLVFEDSVAYTNTMQLFNNKTAIDKSFLEKEISSSLSADHTGYLRGDALAFTVTYTHKIALALASIRKGPFVRPYGAVVNRDVTVNQILLDALESKAFGSLPDGNMYNEFTVHSDEKLLFWLKNKSGSYTSFETSFWLILM